MRLPLGKAVGEDNPIEERNVQGFAQPGGKALREPSGTAQAAAATVRLFLVMCAVVMMTVHVMRHMMTGVMVRLMVGVVHGGRGRRGEDQRGCDNDRQSRNDFAHERLHE
jgi:hypothetical protein